MTEVCVYCGIRISEVVFINLPLVCNRTITEMLSSRITIQFKENIKLMCNIYIIS